MKKLKLNDYQLFYLTIPQRSEDYYLTELAEADAASPQVRDAHFNQNPTLSDNQVSRLATDQLADISSTHLKDDELFTRNKTRRSAH